MRTTSFWFATVAAAMAGAGCHTTPPQGSDDNCAAGKVCVKTNGAWGCAQGCKVDGDCTADGGNPGAACCNSVCVDTSTDNAHCGTCAMQCVQGKSCCASQCNDFQSDVANCG